MEITPPPGLTESELSALHASIEDSIAAGDFVSHDELGDLADPEDVADFLTEEAVNDEIQTRRLVSSDSSEEDNNTLKFQRPDGTPMVGGLSLAHIPGWDFAAVGEDPATARLTLRVGKPTGDSFRDDRGYSLGPTTTLMCGGDSIERAWAPDLETELRARGYGNRVVNLSCGGENTPTILGRIGGWFLATVSGGVIPDDGSSVSVDLTDITGLSATDSGSTIPRLNPLAQAADGFNPCTLITARGESVEGVMTCHDATGSNPFAFQPLRAPVADVVVDFPATVRTYASQTVMNGHLLLGVGQNDNNDTVGDDFTYSERFDLINVFEQRAMSGPSRVLKILPFSGGPTTRLAEETEATRRWGRHAVALRPWLASAAALAAVGATPTATDIINIAAGNVCDSFFTSPDFVHPNALGRDAIVMYIISRLIELGWI